MTISPVTFYSYKERVHLDPGNSFVIASFLEGCAKAVDTGEPLALFDAHELLQSANAGLAVCSNGRDWEVVNGDAPFFTLYHSARLNCADSDSPQLLAFHVRNDTARAQLASLLPPPRAQ